MYIRYSDLFNGGDGSIVYAFLHGLRFDLATTLVACAPLLLLFILPGGFTNRWLTRSFLYILLAIQIILLLYIFGDIHFFADIQRHLSMDILHFWRSVDEIVRMGIAGFKKELLVLLLVLLLYAACYISFVEWQLKSIETINLLQPTGQLVKYSMLLLALIAFNAVGVRGGFQAKPLNVNMAFVNDNQLLGALSLNGVYTTAQAFYEMTKSKERIAEKPLDKQDALVVKRKILSFEDEVIDPDYPLYRRFKYGPDQMRRMNVVLFILESWTPMFTGALGKDIGATPNFDALAREGLLLTNMFANGQRTFEGLLATIGSFPTWNYILIGHSGLLYQTRLRPAAAVFRDLGYETIFIHGGKKASLGIDSMVSRLGFARHVSAEDLEHTSQTHDGIWGIYDEIMFQRAHQEFLNMDKPFFSVILSLSSHLPFKLPSSKFEKFTKFDKTRNEFLNSLHYSDYALGRFFENAKKSSYYDNTLFIIVADHAAAYFSKTVLYNGYCIPGLIIDPQMKLKGKYDMPVSQVDIVPTIFDMLRISAPFTSWGKSIFSKGPRVSVLPRAMARVYVEEPHMLWANREKRRRMINYRVDSKKNIVKSEIQTAKKLQDDMFKYIDFSEYLILHNQVAPTK